ncbi:hypothetical protein K1719_022505 [Acacia pycnantha]|nr:hypothetical protein K1719_022505 [Acacia pycnantha]
MDVDMHLEDLMLKLNFNTSLSFSSPFIHITLNFFFCKNPPSQSHLLFVLFGGYIASNLPQKGVAEVTS